MYGFALELDTCMRGTKHPRLGGDSKSRTKADSDQRSAGAAGQGDAEGRGGTRGGAGPGRGEAEKGKRRFDGESKLALTQGKRTLENGTFLGVRHMQRAHAMGQCFITLDIIENKEWLLQ